MQKTITATLGVAAVLAIVGSFLTFNSGPSNTPGQSLTVGALLPQTGPGAVFADYIKKGLDLAALEINAKNENAITLVYGDSKNDPKEGVSVFQQMVLTKKPPVVITALSSVTKAVAPMAKPNNTVVIGTAVGLPNVTEPSNFVFRVYPEAHGLAGVIAKYANQHFKSAAVVYIDDDFGASGAQVFEDIFSAGGGTVLIKEPYRIVESDFRTQWERIKALSPDCVWITGYGPAYSTIVRQMKEMQVPSSLLADMTLGLPVTLKNVGGAAENVVYVDGPMDKRFAQSYTTAYGEPPTSYAGYAYDIMGMLEKMRSEGKLSAEAIQEGLKSIHGYQGAMGSITILNNRDADLTFTLMKISNGLPTPFTD